MEAVALASRCMETGELPMNDSMLDVAIRSGKNLVPHSIDRFNFLLASVGAVNTNMLV